MPPTPLTAETAEIIESPAPLPQTVESLPEPVPAQEADLAPSSSPPAPPVQEPPLATVDEAVRVLLAGGALTNARAEEALGLVRAHDTARIVVERSVPTRTGFEVMAIHAYPRLGIKVTYLNGAFHRADMMDGVERTHIHN